MVSPFFVNFLQRKSKKLKQGQGYLPGLGRKYMSFLSKQAKYLGSGSSG